MSNLVVIPAREGSQRIIGKNIKNFHGKPIIAWSIELALTCGSFDRVIVSTDSKEISKLSVSLGAEAPFLRPKNISDGDSSVIEVVRHAIDFLYSKGESYELVTLLYPTAPFTRASDLVKAVTCIKTYDFAISVTKFPYPIQRALSISKDEKTLQMINKSNFHKRSQDLENSYHDAGQFIVGKNYAWKEKKPFVDGRALPIIIPRYIVQDIDDEEDWVEAELKFKILNEKKNG